MPANTNFGAYTGLKRRIKVNASFTLSSDFEASSDPHIPNVDFQTYAGFSVEMFGGLVDVQMIALSANPTNGGPFVGFTVNGPHSGSGPSGAFFLFCGGFAGDLHAEDSGTSGTINIEFSFPAKQLMIIDSDGAAPGNHGYPLGILPGEGPLTSRVKFEEEVAEDDGNGDSHAYLKVYLNGALRVDESFDVNVINPARPNGSDEIPWVGASIAYYPVYMSVKAGSNGINYPSYSISGSGDIGGWPLSYPAGGSLQDGTSGSTTSGVRMSSPGGVTANAAGGFPGNPSEEIPPSAGWDVQLFTEPSFRCRAEGDVLLPDGTPYPDPLIVGFSVSPQLNESNFPIHGGHVTTSEITVHKCLYAHFNTAYGDNPFGPITVYPGGFHIVDDPDVVLSCQINNASLVANGDPSNDIRCMGYAQSWQALRISHDAEVVIDDLTSTENWSIDNGSVTIEGGIFKLNAIGNLANAKRVFPDPGIGMQSHRYMKIEYATLGGAHKEIILSWNNNKDWTIKSGDDGEYRTVYIDLCCPENDPEPPRDMDSLWPIHPTNKLPLNEAFNTGINVGQNLRFLEIPDGMTLAIKTLKLVVQKYVKIDILSAFQAFSKTGPEPTNIASKRFILGLVDGRVSLEVSDVSVNIVNQSVTVLSLQDLADQINDTPGWHADAVFSDTGGVPSMSRPAYWLGGGGVSVDGGGIHKWLGMPPGIFPAQVLFDRLVPHCGMQDMYTGIGYGSPNNVMVLKFAMVMRGMAHGLVLDSFDSATPDTEVDLYEQPSQEFRGRGTSDNQGYFATGAPFAHGLQYYKLHSQDDSPQFLAFSRRKTRAIGIGGIPKACHTAVEPSGLFQTVIVKSDGLHVWTYDFKHTDVMTKILHDPSILAANIAFSPIGSGFLSIAYTVDRTPDAPPEDTHHFDTYIVESADNGKAWTDPVLLSSDFSFIGFDMDPVSGNHYIAGYNGAQVIVKRKRANEPDWEDLGGFDNIDGNWESLRCSSGVDRMLLFFGRAGNQIKLFTSFHQEEASNWGFDSDVATSIDFICGDRDQRTGIDFLIGHNGAEVRCYRRIPNGQWENLAKISEWDPVPMGLRCSPLADGRIVATGRIANKIERYASFDNGESWSLE